MACGIAPRVLCAQPAPAAQPFIRYPNGDNPAGSSPSFDDGAWPQAQSGSLPAPGYESDGFFWVRARIGVRANAAPPLAVHLRTLTIFQELWVKGRLVGRCGDFLPHARPLVPPQMLVFDLPSGLVQPGSVAVIALRTWDMRSLKPCTVQVKLDEDPHADCIEDEKSDGVPGLGGPRLHHLIEDEKCGQLHQPERAEQESTVANSDADSDLPPAAADLGLRILEKAATKPRGALRKPTCTRLPKDVGANVRISRPTMPVRAGGLLH